MGLKEVISGGIAALKRATESLQATVTRKAYAGNDQYGNPEYGSPVSHKVIIDYRSRYVTAKDGTQQLSKANVQFLEPLAVKIQDRITMPDGTAPQIMAIEGVLDDMGAYYAPKVYF